MESAAAAVEVFPPQWMHDLVEFRTRLFLLIVEPIIVAVLGPVETDRGGGSWSTDDGSNPLVEDKVEELDHGAFALSSGVNIDCDDVDAGYNGPCYNRSDAANGNLVLFSRADYAGDVHADDSHRRLGFLPNYIEDVGAFRETSMSFLTLLMLFTIMICLFLVLMSCFYHNQKTSPLFISPRRHRLPKLVPPPLPVDSFFSWVRVCFYLSDEEIIERIGWDCLIFIRFHRLALRCIVKMSAFSFVVLLPLNYTGGGHANASDLKGYVGSLLFTDFLRFTMANVSGGSPRLWVHCFAAYLLTGIVVWELLVEYNAFNNVRHRYLLSREPHLRTVLVSNIPRHLRAPSKIGTYFRHVYPDAVKSVSICQNLIELEGLVAKRTSVLSQIERELLILCREEKKKLLGRTRLQLCCRAIGSCYLLERVGLVQSAQERLAALYSKLEILNDKVDREMKRRKRVMKRLDKMESEVGKYDIDYILASPFVNEATTGQRHASGRQSYRPPVHTGAPRNPDGSVNYNPSHCNAEISAATAAVNLGADGEVPFGRAHQNSGPSLRASAVTTSNSDVEYFEEEFDDANQKRRRRPLSRAKAAIRRYTGFMTRRSGEVHHTDDGDYVHTASSGSIDLRGNIEDHTNEVCDKAFVVMRTFTASTIAIQSMHSSKPGSMQVTTAPEPRDILWGNVYLSKGAKRTRSIIGEALILLIITFYVVPVALVSLLVSESALISSSPRLAQLDRASAFFSTGIAMVQPICLVGIQQLLPPLFMQITKAEGLLSFSEAQMKAFSRYFLFQVLNVFLVTSIAGSIFDTVAIIIENPETAFEMLGNALPRMSSFFIT
uniref:CSC1/OSCA1-like 7TM region domain-containing protein n=2 Tax=Odontella aurita TaxID=265563 RepID=A0A6U6K111_9STRA|mmetsp:Transcript_59738/g.177013  ORF Transcript_59738/g.177013 Transcript_59738/m.177013 type:complete len:833 (+) Transcript_59738:93-2591(+)